MKRISLETTPSGEYAVSSIGGETVKSFVPNNLGVLTDSLNLTPVIPKLVAAERALGRLDVLVPSCRIHPCSYICTYARRRC